MRPSARWSLAIALILMLAVGLVTGSDQREFTKTSYGTIPGGTGALFSLLSQLRLTRGRSFSRVAELPATATVWWIAPDGLCRDVADGEPSDAAPGLSESVDWASGGGTAVIVLPDSAQPCLETTYIAGAPAPMRQHDAIPDPDQDGDEQDAAVPTESKNTVTISGALHPTARSLGTAPVQFFASSTGFEVLSSDDSGRELVVSRAAGSGSVVFVATPAPLTNRWIDSGDGALFAVDLAVTLGPPFIDEREHGMLPPQNTIAYLLTSSAVPAFAGAVLLALLALWWGHAPLPPATAGADLPPPPSLETFVSSIATLYATTRDNSHVLLAYQGFALDQLRRSFRLSADVPTQRIFDRIVATSHFAHDDLRLLRDPPSCRRRTELVKAVARIDALVSQVVR